jgi:enoyl-CoA hydratase
MSNIVHYIVDKGVATITIDEGKANAVSFQFLKEVNAALDQAEKKQAEGMTGRPGKFSTGLDLSVVTQDRDAAIKLTWLGAKLTVSLLSFSTP